jgi:hypothetical protein
MAGPSQSRRCSKTAWCLRAIIGFVTLIGGAAPGQAVEPERRAEEQRAAPLVLVRDVVYFLNQDSAQVLIDLETMVRYQASASPDSLAFYVDLFGTSIGPAVPPLRVAADDRYVRRIRVLKTDVTVTRVEIDLKSPFVPKVTVEGPGRLVLRWSLVLPPSPDRAVDFQGQVAIAPLPAPTEQPSIQNRPGPVSAPDSFPVVAPVVPEAAGSSSSGEQFVHGPAKTVQAVRVTHPPAVDGRLDDEAWILMTPVDQFRQREPDEGQSATERTELKVGYDDSAVYFGIRMFDQEPDRIVRRMARRDDDIDADSVKIYLDPYHDHLTGVMFQVSAAGVQRDGQIHDDSDIDLKWDAVWRSATSIDAEGWTAEIRIPLSQLRFVPGASQTWGFNVERYIHRKAEYDWLELRAKNADWLASRMAHLTGLNDIEPGARLEILPYAVARADFIASEPGDPFNDGSALFSSGGLDLKWGLASNVTVDATFNPDFGQVELDPSVVNLSEFETFFEEKRPFFLEAASIFQTVTGDSLFYSRRIGRQPQGFPDGVYVQVPGSSTVLGAGKLSGRTSSGWSFGLLEAVTDRERASSFTDGVTQSVDVEPRTNYLVARLAKDGRRGGFGGLMTATNRQIETDELRNNLADQAYVTAGDGYLYLDRRRDWRFWGEAAASMWKGNSAATLDQQTSSRRYYQRPDATHVHIDPAATSLAGWQSQLGINRQSGRLRVGASAAATSPGFESNDLGFQSRADTVSTSAKVSWHKYNPDRWTRERSIGLSKSDRWNFGRQRQNDGWAISGSATLLNYWEVDGEFALGRETFDDHLTRGGPLAVNPASQGFSLEIESDDRKAVTFSGGLEFESDDAGTWERSVGVSFSFKPAPSIEITTSPLYSRSRSVAQFVDRFRDPLATATFGTRYVFGEIDQTETSMTTQLNLTLTPRLSVQFYIEPFVAVGSYTNFKEFLQPRTFDFLRYGIDAGTIALDEGEYTVDPDGPGPAKPFDFENPDFNEKSLITKTVLRWEWRLGSTLYVVWTQNRSDDRYPGLYDFGRDVRDLFRAPGNDVFLVKMSYWLGR